MFPPHILHNGKMEEFMPQIPDESVDVILTDPPFLYLEHQLDREFDENIFFAETKRVLKKDGFIVLFGRGTSFYRWNTMLSDLGFTFKEEIVWNKSQTSSPVSSLMRVHETISIHTKGAGIINKAKVPYLEKKKHNIAGICSDIKRLCTVLSSSQNLRAVQEYLATQVISYNKARQEKYNLTCSSLPFNSNRTVCAMHQIETGMRETSIIKQVRDHFTSIHPTQKPVRLLERLLALVLPKGEKNPVVLDPFFGSASTLIAGANLGCKVIGIEMNEEYFAAGKERFLEHINSLNEPTLFSE